MKVTISTGGKFHAFRLAYQLQKSGYLQKIFTGYPWFALKKTGVEKKRVKCLILKEALRRSFSKVSFLDHGRIEYSTANLFDRQVAGRISACDIFVGWSGFSLESIKKIRSFLSAKIVLERGSPHIQQQNDSFLEEQESTGIKLGLSNRLLLEKELEEYQLADCICVPSSFAKQTFIEKGFTQEKIMQVSLGVDPEAFRPAGKKDDCFRIICVGINIRKGVHLLLQAMDELKLKNSQVWLIGRLDEEIKPVLKRYSGIFKYFGGLPNSELYKYYSQGSAMVFFSLGDGFGLSVLEAMACGLPVICSDRTGAKDALTEGINGYIVPARNIEKLKEKITLLYERQDLARQMGLEARKTAVENFTWEAYGKKIISNYLRLIG